MKIVTLVLAILVTIPNVYAQQSRSVFRKGYQRFGISSLGSAVANELSPKENFANGNYGARSGLVFESGHIYYFRSKAKARKINYGLDWTFVSMSFNQLSGWNNYSSMADIGSPFSAAISSKLGPVFSFNPTEKLVIDLRAQVAPVYRFTNFYYESSYDENQPENYRYYALYDDYNEIKDFAKNNFAFGIGTNVGITVRRKAIGLSLDYLPVKMKTNFISEEGSNDVTMEKINIKSNSLQFKLSLSL